MRAGLLDLQYAVDAVGDFTIVPLPYSPVLQKMRPCAAANVPLNAIACSANNDPNKGNANRRVPFVNDWALLDAELWSALHLGIVLELVSVAMRDNRVVRPMPKRKHPLPLVTVFQKPTPPHGLHFVCLCDFGTCTAITSPTSSTLALQARSAVTFHLGSQDQHILDNIASANEAWAAETGWTGTEQK
jgi:hypothetical protein